MNAYGFRLASFVALVTAGCAGNSPPRTEPAPVVLAPSASVAEKPAPQVEEPPPGQAGCERRVSDHLDDGTVSIEELVLDGRGRPSRYLEKWVWTKKNSGSERTVEYTFHDDGRMLAMKLRSRGLTGDKTDYENTADFTFEHGAHGEIVQQKAVGDGRTTSLEWKGTFRPAKAVSRPHQPWERPFVFGLSLPHDLVLREVRASMPPFVFEGTVTITSERYGVETVITYDRNGRMTKHQAFLGKFVNAHEYDERGFLKATTGDDGRKTEFRYDGVRGSGMLFHENGAVKEQLFERNAAGELTGATYVSGGSKMIVTRFGPCEVLK